MTFEILSVDDPRLAPSTDRGDALAAVGAAEILEEVEPIRSAIVAMTGLHDDVLLRTCVAGHLTGSAAVVDHLGHRSLVMLHTKLGRWFQPGGHADGEASLAAVALREATEETGIDDLRVVWPAIDVDIHHVPLPGEAPHVHLDVRFLVLAPEGATPARNHESQELRWIDLESLELLDPDQSTRRVVARGLEVARGLL